MNFNLQNGTLLFSFLTFIAMLNAQQKYDLNIDQNLINPTFSPDGNYIALTDKQYSGILFMIKKKKKLQM
jgi:hypothetical protein